jgi:hypothetical protein
MRLANLAMTLLMLIALFGAQGASAASEPKSWRVIQSIGAVSVVAPAVQIEKPKPGTMLPADAIITTGANGRAILGREGQQIVVQPNTRIELAPEQNGRTLLKQVSGIVNFKVDRRKQTHFQVDTPFLAAIVKGTSFEVRVRNDRTDVSVFEGRVEVRANNANAVTLVSPNEIASILAQEPDAIQLQKRDGKSHKVTTDEGRLDGSSTEAPGTGGTTGHTKALVELRGSSDDSARPGARADEGFDNPLDESASGRKASRDGERKGKDGETNHSSEVTVRVASNEAAPSDKPVEDEDEEKKRQAEQDRKNADKDKEKQADKNDEKDEQQLAATAGDKANGGKGPGPMAGTPGTMPGTSTNSFLNTHKVYVEGQLPWKEVGYGALALLGLFVLNALRGFLKRSRQRKTGSNYESGNYY